MIEKQDEKGGAKNEGGKGPDREAMIQKHPMRVAIDMQHPDDSWLKLRAGTNQPCAECSNVECRAVGSDLTPCRLLLKA